LGFDKEFTEIAEVNYFNLKGYDFWVTDDAECCFSFRKHYAGEGFKFPFPVYHLLEYLEPFLHNSNYRTHGKIKARFVFQDSSFLARHLGLVDLPRRMLRHVTGFTPLNMAQWGQDTLGSSCEGGYQWVFPKRSEKIARKIIAEVENRRIKTLITASVPAEALWKRLAKNTQIVDIFEFINQQIL
jgi:Fe-S oxidoreductase